MHHKRVKTAHTQNDPCYLSKLYSACRNSAVLHLRYYNSNQQFKTLSIIVNPKGFVCLFTGIDWWLLSALNDIQHSFCSSVCFQIFGDVLVRMFSMQFYSQQFQSTRAVCDQLITACNQNFFFTCGNTDSKYALKCLCFVRKRPPNVL